MFTPLCSRFVQALQHNWMVSIGVHTNDLFSLKQTQGVPVMQARFDEFNNERRSLRGHEAMQELLGLPESEEELRQFRCSFDDKKGHLVITPAHFAFLAYDQSNMFSHRIRGSVRGSARATVASVPQTEHLQLGTSGTERARPSGSLAGSRCPSRRSRASARRRCMRG